jgi:ribosomal protein S18 acetylase RimI-like enzyme
MENVIIRSATETDRVDITKIIVNSFRDDFSRIPKPIDDIINALKNGVNIERFLVAKVEERTVGTIACTDCSCRAVNINIADCRWYLGFLIGTAAGVFMHNEFSKPLHYSGTIGYIEFVAVSEGFRNKGIASELIHEVVRQTDYSEYILDVSVTNIAAQRCYLKFGFKEMARKKERFPWLKGYNEKVYMKYTAPA